jgi:hypothetical protein
MNNLISERYLCTAAYYARQAEKYERYLWFYTFAAVIGMDLMESQVKGGKGV